MTDDILDAGRADAERRVADLTAAVEAGTLERLEAGMIEAVVLADLGRELPALVDQHFIYDPDDARRAELHATLRELVRYIARRVIRTPRPARPYCS